MNSYITEFLRLLSFEAKTDRISEFEINIINDVIEIKRCKSEMLCALLELVKKFKLRAELDGGVINIDCKESEG